MSALLGKVKWSSLALGLVLVLGAVAVWAAILSSLGETVNTLRSSGASETLLITDRADVYVQRFDNGDVSYRSLDGKPVAAPQGYGVNAANLPVRPYRFGEPLTWHSRVWSFKRSIPPEEHWFLVHNGATPGRAYLEGYNPVTKEVIGYLDRKGFTPSLPPADAQFPIDGSLLATGNALAGRQGTVGQGQVTAQQGPNFGEMSSLHLLADGTIYLVSFEDRSVKPLELPTKVLSVATFTQYQQSQNADGNGTSTTPWAMLRTPTEVLFRSEGSQGESRPPLIIPAELRDHNFTVYACRDDQQIVQCRMTFYWIDKTGTITRTEQPQLAGLNREESMSSFYWWVAVCGPATIWMAIVNGLLAPLSERSETEPHSYATAISESLALSWAPTLMVVIICAALAVWVYRRARRDRYPGAIAWSLLVFLCGPFGLAGYWLQQVWPAREQCPHCGQSVPRNHANCVACGARFPLPEQTGTEIFA